MAHSKRPTLTDKQRAERRRQEQKLTEQAVARLRCSVGWQCWLTVRARVGLLATRSLSGAACVAGV